MQAQYLRGLVPVPPDDPRPVALVTGGARGIGAAIAEALVHSGHSVVTVDMLGEPRADGDRLHLNADVSRPDEVARVVQECVDRFGRLDVLINNAGVLAVHAVHDTPEEIWGLFTVEGVGGVGASVTG